MKVAVIGTGVSGLLAARLLADDHDLHVFEANDYAGGHTNTVTIEVAGSSHAVDTGFMVFNHRTYPNFVKMIKLLGVPEQESDMSFSVRCARSGLEYQGSSLNGLFAQRSNLFRPRFYRMLREILRFNREALRLIEQEESLLGLGDFLEQHRFGKDFVDYYLVPMGAAIWSARPQDFREFPAQFIIRFLENHGLLTIRGRPQWKTIAGGAKRYVAALTRPFAERLRLGCPIQSVSRHQDHVLVCPENQPPERFDAVVMAAHADQTLKMLTDASDAEQAILGSFAYQRNETILHTDVSLLPQRRRAWASWNYLVPPQADQPVVLTYNLNRLQRHQSPETICVTLNDTEAIDPARILRRIEYHHPVYDRAALSAQDRYQEINGQRHTYFCGAYWGYGFHEDGVKSALAVGECFGKRLESCIAAST